MNSHNLNFCVFIFFLIIGPSLKGQEFVELNEVDVSNKKDPFALKKLKDIEGTSIYAGKKTEVVVVENTNASLALNNARQLYKRVSGLNIYQNDDAGLQLNIGGRGLDPNRTSNFSTRQNGYDISADVLGYPESYYTPPAESLEKIEIIRGAASLQYGSQFGGLINFVTKKPSKKKGIRIKQRSTLGSNAMLSSFTSIDSKKNKFSFYTFFNFKRGKGFRPNTEFESSNIFFNGVYDLSENFDCSFEFTGLNYVAQQPGGLNDRMFNENPLQSNRARNWFSVNWLLYNLKLNHRINNYNTQTLNVFALDADRSALGYRSNRVDQLDPMIERDLIQGYFNNWGAEYKFLNKRDILGIKTGNLIGIKLYQSNNINIQGPGSYGTDANFDFYYDDFPAYQNQSEYIYPNLNLALFGENILYINRKTSITPGFRFEFIDTKSNGSFSKMLFDGANNLISDTTIISQDTNTRNFIIFGVGVSHRKTNQIELYANFSQNYRSVTFADISIVNPAFSINPDITDEKGFTGNLGIKGILSGKLSYDINYFYLSYQDRIGFIQKIQQDGNVKSERGNVGNARIFGFESLLEYILLKESERGTKITTFLNSAFLNSEYISAEQTGIIGNEVEFIPKVNIKSGITYSYKDFSGSFQYTFLSQQYSDATNSKESNLSGVIGLIPNYQILDFSLSYKKKKYSLEFGINNILDTSYFTRRATGYPGPGIIPSPRRNFYVTFEFNF
jgi:Fe(3+) dicitrate transport protein